MSDIQYYRATEADIESLIDLRMAFHVEYSGQQTDETLAELKKQLAHYFRAAVAVQQYVSWLATADGKVVGCGGMVLRSQPGNFKNPSGRSGYIMNMYTLPEYRKQGISSTLVQRLMETGRAMGLHVFELHATKAGAPVYEKCGFELHNEPTYRKYD